jgi:hypothetical protein
MKVTATKPGYFGKLREAGETFEVPDGTGKASWFEPVEQAKPEPKGKGKADTKPDESLT